LAEDCDADNPVCETMQGAAVSSPALGDLPPSLGYGEPREIAPS
jgi:hypothetical protein